jgi:hypothetical protein
MTQSITITSFVGGVQGKKFRFFQGEVNSASYGITERKFKFEDPSGNAQDNISISLGKTIQVRASFKLLKTVSQDASVGTNTSVVETIAAKVNYLVGVVGSTFTSAGQTIISPPFFTKGVLDYYLITMETNNSTIENIVCTLEAFNLDFNSQNPDSLAGSLTFNVGGRPNQ